MRRFRTGWVVPAALAICVTGAAAAETPKLEAGAEMLPPRAKPGECYARVFVPPTYRTETDAVLKREAATRLEVVPAEYGWEEQRVVVKEAGKRVEVVPARYEWKEERVLVKEASSRVETVPAVYDTVTEQVLERPAHTVWKKGTGPLQRVDHATGEIMCLVEVPATYKTVTKRVLKTPATTRKIEIPAEYKSVRRQVLVSPPTTREIEIPAEHATVRVKKVVRPETTRTVEIPAEYQNVTKTIQVTDGRMEWRPVLCQTNATEATVQKIQSALARAGFAPGPIDGVLGEQTLSAVRDFQRRKGISEGYLTMETLEALGVNL